MSGIRLCERSEVIFLNEDRNRYPSQKGHRYFLRRVEIVAALGLAKTLRERLFSQERCCSYFSCA
jgi:hypothetical protein